MRERYRAQNSVFQQAAGWITWKKCGLYERRLFPQFQAVTMVSEMDRQAVRRAIPDFNGHLEVIPNGVDLEWCPVGLAEPKADTIVFNGSLTYAANLEAMRFFTGQVLPLIWQEKSNVRAGDHREHRRGQTG